MTSSSCGFIGTKVFVIFVRRNGRSKQLVRDLLIGVDYHPSDCGCAVELKKIKIKWLVAGTDYYMY